MRFDDINLELIRCFVVVAECKSFTEAGERLHKSQSAISVRMKKLETLLGRQLLDRSSRSVELSSAGELFLPYAMRLLHLNEEAIGALQAPEIAGKLRIGLVEYFAAHRLPALLVDIQRKFPAVEMQIRLGLSSELFRALDANEVDVIIAKADDSRSGGVPILDETLHWVHCMEKPPVVPQSQSKNKHGESGVLPLCLMPEPCIYRHRALKSLKGVNIGWREVVSSSSVLGLQSVIKAGLGVGVLGTSCLLPEMNILSEKDGMPPLSNITLCLFGPHKEKSRLIEPVLSHLCDVVDEKYR